jgi:cytochrome c5
MSNANDRSFFVSFVIIVGLGFSFAAFGEDAATTFKAKCAMCHGADAAGNTSMGKKFNIPDLRAPDTQSQSGATAVRGRMSRNTF